MDELDPFRRLEAPDQWDEILARSDSATEADSPDDVRRWRLLAAVAATAVLAVGGLVILSARSDRSTQPAGPTSDATLPAVAPTLTSPATTDPAGERSLSCADGEFKQMVDLLRSNLFTAAVDRDPAARPAPAAPRVVAGVVRSVSRRSGAGPARTTLEVDVTETLAGSPVFDVARVDFSSLWADDRSADPLQRPVELAGLRFVAGVAGPSFANPDAWSVVGQLWVACDDTSPATAVLPAASDNTEPQGLREIAEELREQHRTNSLARLATSRPIIDAATCAPIAATEQSELTLPVAVFGVTSINPVSIQVWTGPDGFAGPIVIVSRFADAPIELTGADVVDITNSTIRIRVDEAGNGEAVWDLPDGGTGVLRSIGVDQGALVKHILTAQPRRNGLGFEFFTNVEARVVAGINGSLRIAADNANTHLAAATATSTCQESEGGDIYTVTEVVGDAAYLALVALEHAPLAVESSESRLVLITGPAGASAPTIDDVRQATPDEWTALLAAPGN